MSKKKTTTTENQQTTNQYGWESAPINEQMQGVIDLANKPIQADPSIQHRYAAMEEDVRRSAADPFGAGTSADVRQKSQLSRILGVQKDRDKAMREGYHQAEDSAFSKRTAAAALTMPQLVNTGGTSTGNQVTTQSGGILGPISDAVKTGAQVASL